MHFSQRKQDSLDSKQFIQVFGDTEFGFDVSKNEIVLPVVPLVTAERLIHCEDCVVDVHDQ